MPTATSTLVLFVSGVGLLTLKLLIFASGGPPRPQPKPAGLWWPGSAGKPSWLGPSHKHMSSLNFAGPGRVELSSPGILEGPARPKI